MKTKQLGGYHSLPGHPSPPVRVPREDIFLHPHCPKHLPTVLIKDKKKSGKHKKNRDSKCSEKPKDDYNHAISHRRGAKGGEILHRHFHCHQQGKTHSSYCLERGGRGRAGWVDQVLKTSGRKGGLRNLVVGAVLGAESWPYL